MNLTPHFTLEELTFSDTARRRGIDNAPSLAVLDRLQLTAQKLEQVRVLLGNVAVRVTSGYRCLELNRLLGSADSSAHIQGLAADFVAPAHGDPLAIARHLASFAESLAFDQLIYEFGSWVHIGFTVTAPRHQVLTIDETGTREGLP